MKSCWLVQVIEEKDKDKARKMNKITGNMKSSRGLKINNVTDTF